MWHSSLWRPPHRPPMFTRRMAAEHETRQPESRLNPDSRAVASPEQAQATEEIAAGVFSSWVTLPPVAAAPLAFTDTGLKPGTKYTYRVAAKGVAGNSSFSPQRSATTAK